VIVDDCCRARTHIRDGHRDDGVDRMSAVLRGKLAPIRRMIEVQEGEVVLLKRFAHSSYRIKAIAPPGRQGVGDSTPAGPYAGYRSDYEPHSGSIPSLSLTARLSLCLQPRYRSVV
jgi:hypothetical protein